MEIEFKLAVPAERLEEVEQALRAQKTSRTRLQARYFDTADAALARHGVVLRLRKEGTHWVQTAKAVVEGQGALHRLEHNVTLDGRAAKAVPDPLRHADSPVGKLLGKALGDAACPLGETLSTDIWRLARHERLGETTVELALDVGQVMGGLAEDGRPRSSAVCELELELVQGRVEDLVEIARGWCERHGLWLSTLSKAERGQRLAHAADQGYAVRAEPPQLAGKTGAQVSGPAFQRAVLAACLAQVLPNASELASGNTDAEVVHQLRVGIRRLRTALRELGAFAPEPAPQFDASWEPALTAVFRRLGAQRDTALLLTEMAPRLKAAGAPEIRIPRSGTKAVDIRAVVRAVSFQVALVGLIGLAAPTDQPAPGGDDDLRRLLKKRLRKLQHQLLADGARFESLPVSAQHRMRKRLKRLRYLAEFAAPLFDAKAAAHDIAHLEPAQDALGAFNDANVALARYREAAVKDPGAWFAVGWLVAQQGRMARACRKALQRLGKLHGFWDKAGGG
ncbi:hypothetical protein RD110_20160 [Rhodoferax koreense]|uniref:Inorganic triphosphatase n=1 Tax=Rhodoferax koreensis TaxID=1842727 RepID=A0A1P8JZX8_9BURK|nr:CYTH and CHAD domain-containing protein [Rhodoferax koreense]APW39241.1 hypothetical protein RD110_20160 [Rhodoferax koreense]